MGDHHLLESPFEAVGYAIKALLNSRKFEAMKDPELDSQSSSTLVGSDYLADRPHGRKICLGLTTPAREYAPGAVMLGDPCQSQYLEDEDDADESRERGVYLGLATPSKVLPPGAVMLGDPHQSQYQEDENDADESDVSDTDWYASDEDEEDDDDEDGGVPLDDDDDDDGGVPVRRQLYSREPCTWPFRKEGASSIRKMKRT